MGQLALLEARITSCLPTIRELSHGGSNARIERPSAATSTDSSLHGQWSAYQANLPWLAPGSLLKNSDFGWRSAFSAAIKPLISKQALAAQVPAVEFFSRLLESEWNLSSVTPDCGNMREHETFVSAPWPGFLKSILPGTSAQRYTYQLW